MNEKLSELSLFLRSQGIVPADIGRMYYGYEDAFTNRVWKGTLPERDAQHICYHYGIDFEGFVKAYEHTTGKPLARKSKKVNLGFTQFVQARGWTIQTLCENIGVCEGYFYMAKRNEQTLPDKRVKQVADCLECTEKEVITAWNNQWPGGRKPIKVDMRLAENRKFKITKAIEQTMLDYLTDLIYERMKAQ